ncbi:PQQ-binding-like beta-propeller repeat protein [Saccharicrinis aurantiacus]|uniref:PQQ-binding-like beta-propeller repeat protein n=1 Tax=Saccharicrinis aurantiacus TaxID=1849719 RepID=UPI00095032B8|nr:PQQ-binding-like beta-propeller repeat protein [Saccharicrinis aurantiacus]
MTIHIKSIFTVLAAVCMLFANAQVKHSYTFDNDEDQWSSKDANLWSHTSDKNDNGSFSLTYKIGDELTFESKAILSLDTELHTVMKVRTADYDDTEVIIATDYDGTVLAIDYSGAILWKNNVGDGIMNHDIWCADINGDNKDEVLVASANGKVYCLNSSGKELWQFKPYDTQHLTPMYAVCVVKDAALTPYVVCGNFDTNCYYLSATGELVQTLPSNDYSQIKAWGNNAPDNYYHYANFLRPIPQADGSDDLLMHASNNHMQNNGHLYLFKPLVAMPYKSITDVNAATVIGEVRVEDPDKDGNYEVLLGTSGLSSQSITRINLSTEDSHRHTLTKIGTTSYRVSQGITIPDGDSYQYLTLTGSYMVLLPSDLDESKEEKIFGFHCYNDIWKDSEDRLILASSQDGGSAIHIIDTKYENWKDEFSKLSPPGKIAKIYENEGICRANLAAFEKPSYQKNSNTVYCLEGSDDPVAQKIKASENNDNPIFLDYYWHKNQAQDKDDWDHAIIYADNETYLNKRDARIDYVLTESEILDLITPGFAGNPGVSFWGGHGNDPLYYGPETLKKVMDYGTADDGKKTVMIYPEMNGSSTDFIQVMDDHLYPLAEHALTNNSNIFIRNKDIFWQGAVYLPAWSRLVSGEYSSVFTTGLEETTDKTQDMSIVGRMGLWASGSVDNWGMRCSRDNPSFDRSRQFSYQRLNNHFLRTMVYSMANGSSFLNVTYANPEHQTLAWELVWKGALYVPRRDEILSISPVHISIHEPDEHYIHQGENNKWNTFYDKEYEENHPAVFSHLNGSWMGAPVTPWDFSSYASGAKDRRQNFIPQYHNGTVLITPVQNGPLADADAPRGKMADNLHPIYKDIMNEYITNGIDYLSETGSTLSSADTYYEVVKSEIEKGAEKLPLTISGDNVAWVVAQVGPKQLRLTLVDAGYINPNDRKIKVNFHTVTPVAMTDILNNETFSASSGSVEVEVPCGWFRFIDIELDTEL